MLFPMKAIALTLCFVLLFVSLSHALSINDPAPLFSLRDSSGIFFYLSDYIGANKKGKFKGIIINFFSSTCKPCKKELPVLNSLVDELAEKGIKVIIVAYQEDFDKFDEMLTTLKIDKPLILSDKYGRVGKKYMVRGLPMTYFIGSDGKIKDIIRGELPEIEKVLKKKAGKLLK